MPCTAVSIQAGLFINTQPWSNAPNASQGGRSVSISSGASSITLTVTGPTGSNFITIPSGGSFHYKFFGSGNHLAVWSTLPGVIQDRRVSLVDFSQSPPSFELIVFVSVQPAVGPPQCDFSQGNGNACLIWAPNSLGEVTSLAIYRSDNGDVLCPGPPPFTPTGQTAGEATATELIIHYSSGGMSKTAKCPMPLGKCKITPATLSFPDVVVGGCAVTPPPQMFTIKNEGTDCLVVNNIQNSSGPFALNPAPSFPIQLSPNQTTTVTVRFSPGAVGNFNNSLSVTTTPANGDNSIACTGKGVSPQRKITLSAATINFGKQPVGSTSTKTVTITNTGTQDVTLSVAGASGGPFAWGAVGPITLTCGASTSINITFTPSVEGSVSATLTVSSNAQGAPHTVTLVGEGCVANSEIQVPAVAPINFGQVEQGFRTVRFFTVKNNGDGVLTFNAAISGPDAALFGLQPPSGSVTDVLPNRSYSVDPKTACGAISTGLGETYVAIVFWANEPPKVCNATLTLSGHNATNFPAMQTWVFPLSAEITPPAAVDAGLVIDRSGSMNDPLGTKKKMDSAVAAAQLFTQLLRPDMDDRMSVVRFHHLPDVIQNMAYVTTNVSGPDREKQSTIVSKIGSQVPPPDGWTAIAAGCLVSFGEIAKPRTSVPPLLRQACLLLTDGLDNTGFKNPVDNQWYSLTGGMKYDPAFPGDSSKKLPTQVFKPPPGVKFYAVGLGTGNQVDSAHLQQATQSTGGFFGVADNLSGPLFYQLEKFYLQVFMDVVSLSPITDPSFTILPGDKHEHEFAVLRGDVSALVVMFDYDGQRLPFQLLAPNGELLDVTSIPAGYQARWGSTNTARFFELKTPAKEPHRYEGTWKVLVWHDGKVCEGPIYPREAAVGFLPRKCQPSKDPVRYGLSIGVGSNFRMVPFATPGPLFIGDSILLSALVSEAGLPVTGCTVTVAPKSPSGFVFPALTLFDDGTHQDGEAADGEYAAAFHHTLESGVYKFSFRATGYSRGGKPVVREGELHRFVAEKGWAPGVEDGGRPGLSDECCEKILRALDRQTGLLKELHDLGRNPARREGPTKRGK